MKATFYPAYQCAGKPRVRKNAWDNWYGYIGSRRVVAFSNSSTQTQEQAANQWLADMLSNNKPGKHGILRDSCDLGCVDEGGKLVNVGSSSLIGKPKVVPGEVVEIKCLYSSPSLRLIQPTTLRRRDDKLGKDCGVSQVREIINKNWRY